MIFEQFDLDMAIARMQDAVDIVLSSEHETSKVAACLYDERGGADHIIARTNHRPQRFIQNFDWQERIGKSSQFIHAEAGCLLEYDKPALGHTLCVTDPFCPNCAKTISESGVQRVLIDHKGMDKDFVQRRGSAFQQISLMIAEQAGIDVFILYRKERRFELLRAGRHDLAAAQTLDISAYPSSPLGQLPANDTEAHHIIEGRRPATYIFNVPEELAQTFQTAEQSSEAFDDALMEAAQISGADQAAESSVCCFVSQDDHLYILRVDEHLPLGLTDKDIADIQPDDTDKYRFTVDALNRLYFTLKRQGYTLEKNAVYCNRVPSSRAFVNGMLTPFQYFLMASDIADHDPQGMDAFELLVQQGFIKGRFLSA